MYSTYRYISSASFFRAASSAAYTLLFFKSSNISRNFLLTLHKHIHTCIHTYIHQYIHTHINTYIHTYTYYTLNNLRVTPSASRRSNSSRFNLSIKMYVCMYICIEEGNCLIYYVFMLACWLPRALYVVSPPEYDFRTLVQPVKRVVYVCMDSMYMFSMYVCTVSIEFIYRYVCMYVFTVCKYSMHVCTLT